MSSYLFDFKGDLLSNQLEFYKKYKIQIPFLVGMTILYLEYQFKPITIKKRLNILYIALKIILKPTYSIYI